MQEDNDAENNSESTEPVIVIGSAAGMQAQAETPMRPADTGPVRHRFAESYVIISLIAAILLGVVLSVTLSIIFVFLGRHQ